MGPNDVTRRLGLGMFYFFFFSSFHWYIRFILAIYDMTQQQTPPRYKRESWGCFLYITAEWTPPSRQTRVGGANPSHSHKPHPRYKHESAGPFSFFFTFFFFIYASFFIYTHSFFYTRSFFNVQVLFFMYTFFFYARVHFFIYLLTSTCSVLYTWNR